MLPRSARLTSPSDFARATKSGIRLTSPSLVTYVYQSQDLTPARCGLIISKSVGGSVARHTIARQVRHSVAEYLPEFPTGSLLVIRALPSAHKRSLPSLRAQLSDVLPALANKVKVSR